MILNTTQCDIRVWNILFELEYYWQYISTDKIEIGFLELEESNKQFYKPEINYLLNDKKIEKVN